MLIYIYACANSKKRIHAQYAITLLIDFNFSIYFQPRTSILCSRKSDKTAFITGTETEFPNCLYAYVSAGLTINESGKPCNRAHSLGVILRAILF